ncbi:MAG: hypothetical protein QGD92_15290, partial [Gammaproteobacteria bacterium]|nr:hypothetical protein [Gammaproteobacteria bacterium]
MSVPFQLRYLFATQPQVMSKVLAIVHRVISTYLVKRAGFAIKKEYGMSWARRLKRVCAGRPPAIEIE